MPSAKETAQIMMQNFFRIHGFPKDNVSDRGPQFISRLWEGVCPRPGSPLLLPHLGHRPTSAPPSGGLSQKGSGPKTPSSTRVSTRAESVVVSYLHLKVPSKKLAPWFVGPFPIIKVISPAAIHLCLPRSLRVHPTFHVSEVKPTEDSPMVPATKPPPPLETADGGLLYKVKRLLAVRNRGRGKQFLVDWEGYGPEERRWVSQRYIDDSSLIQDFYRDHPDLPGPSGVSPRRGGSCPCFVLSFPVFYFEK